MELYGSSATEEFKALQRNSGTVLGTFAKISTMTVNLEVFMKHLCQVSAAYGQHSVP